MSEKQEDKKVDIEAKDENLDNWIFEIAEGKAIKIEPPSPEKDQNDRLLEVVNGRVTMSSLAKLATAEPVRLRVKILEVNMLGSESEAKAVRLEEDTTHVQLIESPSGQGIGTTESQPDESLSQPMIIKGENEVDDEVANGARQLLAGYYSYEETQSRDSIHEKSQSAGQHDEDDALEDQTTDPDLGGVDTFGSINERRIPQDNTFAESKCQSANETENSSPERKDSGNEGMSARGDIDLSVQGEQIDQQTTFAEQSLMVTPEPEPVPEPMIELEPQLKLSSTPPQHQRNFDIIVPSPGPRTLSVEPLPSAQPPAEVKRPRGRPRKIPRPDGRKESQQNKTYQLEGTTIEVEVPGEEGASVPQKRGRGRPRKSEVKAEVGTGTEAGGKRKAAEQPTVPVEKKRRGRPPKKQ
jgi:hypothetical protein